MSQASQFLSSWKVRAISVLPNDKGIEVMFAVEGQDAFRFRTRKFGIGKRGARAAALARFAAQAGFGKVEDLFRDIVNMPADTVGEIFYPGPVELAIQPKSRPSLCCVWPDESAE